MKRKSQAIASPEAFRANREGHLEALRVIRTAAEREVAGGCGNWHAA